MIFPRSFSAGLPIMTGKIILEAHMQRGLTARPSYSKRRVSHCPFKCNFAGLRARWRLALMTLLPFQDSRHSLSAAIAILDAQ